MKFKKEIVELPKRVAKSKSSVPVKNNQVGGDKPKIYGINKFVGSPCIHDSEDIGLRKGVGHLAVYLKGQDPKKKFALMTTTEKTPLGSEVLSKTATPIVNDKMRVDGKKITIMGKEQRIVNRPVSCLCAEFEKIPEGTVLKFQNHPSTRHEVIEDLLAQPPVPFNPGCLKGCGSCKPTSGNGSNKIGDVD